LKSETANFTDWIQPAAPVPPAGTFLPRCRTTSVLLMGEATVSLSAAGLVWITIAELGKT
jgi:hypothetical protein